MSTGTAAPRIDAVEDPTERIGETPLVDLTRRAPGLYAKYEAANPFSVKDRIALAMVERAEREAGVDADTPLVEPTSGNTGIGLAFVAAVRGYDLALTMPASMSEERRRLLSALGADLELTPAEDGMGGAIDRAEELAAERDGVLLRQFENEANPAAHRTGTGPEIWRDTDGAVDCLVAGVGTGGTITGIARHVEVDRGASLRSVAVEPAASPTLSAPEPDDAGHDIQGIGPGFVPEVLDTDLIDDVERVTGDEARAAARSLAREDGLLVGVSAGAALSAAERVAERRPAETTVVVLPDTGERYLSTDLFA
ncbi:cysteine synthase A [Halobaculum sp. EA56]|uniref:cysteine synthase A n=1 Tax=Halobaculum sp. EA56 TaxID=3421648 RepID=UPI003EBDB1E7